MSRSNLNLIAAGLATTAVALAAYFWLGRGPNPPSPTENPTGVASRDTISALGRLEPKGGVTDVGGTTGERVDQLKVAEGDRVEAGQELALLGSYPLRKSEHQLAEIQVQEEKPAWRPTPPMATPLWPRRKRRSINYDSSRSTNRR